ncbi:LysR family transcriptional regulator [Paenibacillus sp. WLX1005]|uniref:LysR family transcriptional regulator n=1 Tax=Paenibacillus sp. WLX1005 TaxID=3243766 RepID=UPI0039842EB9
MSIHKYEVLLKVVELGSLTRAAEVLGFTQSGVSHIIHGLEREFGFPLLLRDRSGVRLTANGERVLIPMRETVNWNEQLKQVVSSIHGLASGVIRIGTFTSVSVHWLPGMIKEFQRHYPGITFRLIEGDYEEIEEWIANGEIDCGFMTLPARGTFDILPLRQDRMLVIVPPDHPLREADAFPLSRLSEEDFIMPREGSDYDVRRVLEHTGITPNVRFVLGDDYAIIAMVENGLGISILPELVLQGRDHNAGMLELEERSFRSLGLAVQSLSKASPAMRRFLEYVKEWVQQVEKRNVEAWRSTSRDAE